MSLLYAVAALWGLAEAVAFVIVPDVFVSLVVLQRGARAGLIAALWAALGAAAGGLVVYLGASVWPHETAQLLVALPGIDQAKLDDVRTEFAADGILALATGALSGTPYKLYAAVAPTAGIEASLLAAATIPARLIRFVPVALATAGLAAILRPNLSERLLLALWLGFWIVLYAVYFAVFPA